MGFSSIHIVDLLGALESSPVSLKVLEKIAKATKLVIEFGGGIKSIESAQKAFDSGAKMIVCGSVAVNNPEILGELLYMYGNERIILGADVIDEKIKINGWKRQTDIYIEDIISSYTELNIKKVICTDISKDGMMKGPSFELYQKLTDKFPHVEFTASGGVSSAEDLDRISMTGVKSVIIGKAFYEGMIPEKEIQKWLLKG
jgi:phosphoribosylformimino-5-aminoimidazole carboxamide ribotide isomerase